MLLDLVARGGRMSWSNYTIVLLQPNNGSLTYLSVCWVYIDRYAWLRMNFTCRIIWQSIPFSMVLIPYWLWNWSRWWVTVLIYLLRYHLFPHCGVPSWCTVLPWGRISERWRPSRESSMRPWSGLQRVRVCGDWLDAIYVTCLHVMTIS